MVTAGKKYSFVGRCTGVKAVVYVISVKESPRGELAYCRVVETDRRTYRKGQMLEILSRLIIGPIEPVEIEAW